MLDSFVHPIKYWGSYPNNWAGFYFKQRLNYGKWLSVKGYHIGVDYNRGTNDLGDPVYAVGNGVVVSSSGSGVYGYRITIKHRLSPALARKLGTDWIITLYGHVQKSRVKSGQAVKKGQQICELGKAGTKFPHLHFEMYKPHDYASVRSAYPSYPADNLSNIKKNYFDGYRIIEENKIIAGEPMKVIDYKKQRDVARVQRDAARAQRDSLQERLAEVQAALANEKSKPPKTIVKEIEKIVEKEVPVESVYAKENNNLLKKLISIITGIFK